MIKSKTGNVFGGFTNQVWSSEGGCITKGMGTFIFSLDLQTVFPQRSPHSIYCYYNYGPSFGWNSLLVGDGEKMNAEDKSWCYSENHMYYTFMKLPYDKDGNNMVTGQGSKYKGQNRAFFTCVDIEVYSVIY